MALDDFIADVTGFVGSTCDERELTHLVTGRLLALLAGDYQQPAEFDRRRSYEPATGAVEWFTSGSDSPLIQQSSSGLRGSR